MADLVEVVVKVPSDRVAELYAAVAQLLRPQSGAPTGQGTLREEVPGEFHDWHRGDEIKAKQVMTHSSDMAQKILRYLAGHPNQPLLGDQIAKDLGFPAGRQSVAGALSSVGINCTKVGRRMPFMLSYDEGATAGYYIMPTEIAAMFRAAQ